VLDLPTHWHGVANLANGDRAATVHRGTVTAPCTRLATHRGLGYVGWIQPWAVPLLRGLGPKSAHALFLCLSISKFCFQFKSQEKFVKLQKFIENKIKVIKCKLKFLGILLSIYIQ
jgi:hypothetical protein